MCLCICLCLKCWCIESSSFYARDNNTKYKQGSIFNVTNQTQMFKNILVRLEIIGEKIVCEFDAASQRVCIKCDSTGEKRLESSSSPCVQTPDGFHFFVLVNYCCCENFGSVWQLKTKGIYHIDRAPFTNFDKHSFTERTKHTHNLHDEATRNILISNMQ